MLRCIIHTYGQCDCKGRGLILKLVATWVKALRRQAGQEVRPVLAFTCPACVFFVHACGLLPILYDASKHSFCAVCMLVGPTSFVPQRYGQSHSKMAARTIKEMK